MSRIVSRYHSFAFCVLPLPKKLRDVFKITCDLFGHVINVNKFENQRNEGQERHESSEGCWQAPDEGLVMSQNKISVGRRGV